AGASVKIAGTELEATTGLDGSFRFGQVSAGSYILSGSKAGYQPVTVSGVSVTDGRASRVDLPLVLGSDSIITLEAFTISAEVLQTSGLGLLNARQKAAAVSDAIGSEQMSRLGFSTAASAMRAVTGASVVGGKYVYIRGLGERYSTTLIN